MFYHDTVHFSFWGASTRSALPLAELVEASTTRQSEQYCVVSRESPVQTWFLTRLLRSDYYFLHHEFNDRFQGLFHFGAVTDQPLADETVLCNTIGIRNSSDLILLKNLASAEKERKVYFVLRRERIDQRGIGLGGYAEHGQSAVAIGDGEFRGLKYMFLRLLAPGSEKYNDNGISPVSGERCLISPNTCQAEPRRLLPDEFVLSRGTITARASAIRLCGCHFRKAEHCQERKEDNEKRYSFCPHGNTSSWVNYGLCSERASHGG